MISAVRTLRIQDHHRCCDFR